MGKWIKRVAKGLGVLVAVAAVGLGGFAWSQASAYDASMAKVYNVPPLALTHSTDPAAIARGEHLAKSIAGCATLNCHGPDLAAGKVTDMGPVATLAAPNITTILPTYSDGELARLIRHGIKKDNHSVCFMPMQDVDWLPDSDVVALLSYLRTVPVVDRQNTASTKVKLLGKILDRKDFIPGDIARRIDHDHIEIGPAPSPTPEYGKYIARLCTGCHGPSFSGGKIPGTPPKIPPAMNLTPDPSGMQGWTYEDFDHLIQTATRKDGKALDPFMPVEALRNMDDTEKHALFAFLQSLPPRPYGHR